MFRNKHEKTLFYTAYRLHKQVEKNISKSEKGLNLCTPLRYIALTYVSEDKVTLGPRLHSVIKDKNTGYMDCWDDPGSISQGFMLSSGLNFWHKILSQSCKCAPKAPFKQWLLAELMLRPGFTTALAWRVPLPLLPNTSLCNLGIALPAVCFIAIRTEGSPPEDKLHFLPPTLGRVTETQGGTSTMSPALDIANRLVFPVGFGYSSQSFHGWFKECVPNLELLTPVREQATWQMPWALNASSDLKPRPSSPQVVLRFVNLLPNAGLGLDQVISFMGLS